MAIKTPQEMDDALRRAFSRSFPEWLVDDASFVLLNPTLRSALVEKPLGRMNEKEGALNLTKTKALIQSWKRIEARHGWSVGWKTTQWRQLGISVDLPSWVEVREAADLCEALKPDGIDGEAWKAAVHRVRAIAMEFGIPFRTFDPDDDVQKGSGRPLLRLIRILRNSNALWPKEFDENELKRFTQLLKWLLSHPDSGLFIREIPVEGIDTKWFENHQALIAGVWQLIKEFDGKEPLNESVDFITALGLRRKPLFVRVRHASFWTGGDPNDVVQLTLDRLAASTPSKKTVVIIENEQTGLSLDIPPNIPILIGMGYGVTALYEAEWLVDCRILYFGDLDTHGLAILSDLRKIYSQTESVMMDVETFMKYRHLAVSEPTQVKRMPDYLSERELNLLEMLSETKGRLEQERIPIADINREFNVHLD